MFIWTFFITTTYEITSCSYVLKSWNTLYLAYMGGRFCHVQGTENKWTYMVKRNSCWTDWKMMLLLLAWTSTATYRVHWSLLSHILPGRQPQPMWLLSNVLLHTYVLFYLPSGIRREWENWKNSVGIKFCSILMNNATERWKRMKVAYAE